MDYRIEKDTLGEVKVPADKRWGAQTQRSFENFKIGEEKMPLELIKAIAVVKEACAIANCELEVLDARRSFLICKVAEMIREGELDSEFPLSVWQTGSGTQTNMNVNEVIANVANGLDSKTTIHPNDHVNKSQSSNDVFPTAIHLAAVLEIEDKLLPAILGLIESFKEKEEKYARTLKSGRTHLQDAVPMTFGQEVSAWRSMLEKDVEQIKSSLDGLYELPLGGTAVGTGLNAPKDFDKYAVDKLVLLTCKSFRASDNKFL